MSSNLLERDRKAVWHPFTQHGIPSELLRAARAQGAHVFDDTGKQYLDLMSSWWVSIHGHCHPRVVEAISQQAATLDHVLFAGATHEPAVKLAEELLDLAGIKAGKVFYTDDGSTAVETAVKMALQYFGNRGEKRTKIVAFENAYHGDTFGAMTLGQSTHFFTAFPATALEVEFLPVPQVWEGHTDDAAEDAVVAQFEEIAARGDCAAVIFEPLVQGAGGMLFHSKRFLSAIVRTAKKHGVLVIADEIMTGLGRTGEVFATDHLDADARPDILCAAKGLSGGMLPLAVTITHDFIYDAFIGETFSKALAHGHSYTANPIACAGGVVSMELLRDGATIQARDALSDAMRKHFLGLVDRYPDLLEKPRILGGVAAVNLAPESVEYGSTVSRRLQQFYHERGLILRPVGPVIYLMPPYKVDEQELADACEVVAESLERFVR
ncbi:adenosylmethionine--8-amino-7-oxononanoate transaminase [Sulfuriroseicoccus oceanibius]|uniref:Adenosylmethionine-8-amino-7-oxononanoate aminotransferase n=1 Tax=Sulfuriroseicoccus oceanibius TaxID=2707525 RepID=A0A6B3LAW1_9BACT|nr:adenosylmethionine--8-amino-7-oxononanoate transaminase [Sulfuriroseicoccus oceanibius]QQL45749.1 adenosylmethionine--8-amino-7-oxononanoate transaminase [Sulfuriroseicoccus oceanibius]